MRATKHAILGLNEALRRQLNLVQVKPPRVVDTDPQTRRLSIEWGLSSLARSATGVVDLHCGQRWSAELRREGAARPARSGGQANQRDEPMVVRPYHAGGLGGRWGR
jgi:hypothetical protein